MITQRDLNIALGNELAISIRKLGIDTLDVLEAAGTMWPATDRRRSLLPWPQSSAARLLSILELGLTFKENCSDLSNIQVVQLLEVWGRYGMEPPQW